ncbi:hypothetical protein Arnit_2154 [Arcobacter nitrofigilis DSM 7299]|uniref:Uncharacterized protein n=1 Tax=Arcobacter nitrofigilis (strain ATCC 33309 / DSM 7299 / CCUG 15893 / LMG 7604 / NCTC 12251 / CI) TaxID=572480 RepID=D5V0J5_ARCNC|nr:hypothetical protein [Arcobacter nitrofigilis]ADG93807.1 hypothetical protein Arnit_2154 [Arcobacter nitrofigilis DSM 7299]
MNNEIKNEQIELIPDKDGFLFEVEHKMYLIGQGYILVLFSALLLLLFYLADFSLTNIYEHGRLGRLVIVFSIPGYFYYIIKTLYYLLIQKRKVVKFYETYILFPSSFSIVIEDTKKMYRIKWIMLYEAKGESLYGIKKLFLILLFFVPNIIIISSSVFMFYRKFYQDNLVFISKTNEKTGGIAYGLLNKKEQIKVKLYFEKYLNINIDELEQRLILLPNE